MNTATTIHQHLEFDKTITVQFQEGHLSNTDYDEYFILTIDGNHMYMTREQAYLIKDSMEDFFVEERLEYFGDVIKKVNKTLSEIS